MRISTLLGMLVVVMIFSLAPPGPARADAPIEPTRLEIGRVTALTESMFAAENDVLLSGEPAVGATPEWVKAMGPAGEMTYSGRVEAALGLHHSVVDEGLEITSSETSLDGITVTKDKSGQLNGTVTVTVAQTYFEPATQEVSDASWTDEFELVLTPAATDSTLSVDSVKRLMPVADLGADANGPSDLSEEERKGDVSSADRSAAEVVPENTALALPRSYDVTRFVNYALEWTEYGTGINPEYPSFSNNCANFASQSLNKAGWARTGGVNPKDLGNWDDNLTGPSGATYTWAGAKYLFRYAKDTKHLAYMPNIWHATPSDLYFLDWDNDGDSVIDHVAVVTARTSMGTPRISQRTTRRHNVLLTTWLRIIADSTGPDPIWYGRLNRKTA